MLTEHNTTLAGAVGGGPNTSYSIQPCIIPLLITVGELVATTIIAVWHTTLSGTHTYSQLLMHNVRFVRSVWPPEA